MFKIFDRAYARSIMGADEALIDVALLILPKPVIVLYDSGFCGKEGTRFIMGILAGRSVDKY